MRIPRVISRQSSLGTLLFLVLGSLACLCLVFLTLTPTTLRQSLQPVQQQQTTTAKTTDTDDDKQNDMLLAKTETSPTTVPTTFAPTRLAPSRAAMSETCLKLWEWPSLERNWKLQQQQQQQQQQNGPTRKDAWHVFVADRSHAHPTARGRIYTKVRLPKTDMRHQTVAIYVTHQDAWSTNVWHRMAVQYEAWVALQVATSFFAIFHNATIIYKLQRVQGNKHNNSPLLPPPPPPQGWTNLGPTTSFDNRIIPTNTSELQVVAPTDGLLWDLAWDITFDCRNSKMFQKFVDLYRLPDDDNDENDVDSNHDSGRGDNRQQQQQQQQQTRACLISRKGHAQRVLRNRNEVLTLLQRYFGPNVSEILITPTHTTAAIRREIRPCRLLVGVHGAGLYNTIFAADNAIVIELWPNMGRSNNPPAYFRNLSLLLNHDYHGIVGNFSMQQRSVIADIQSLEAVIQEGVFGQGQ